MIERIAQPFRGSAGFFFAAIDRDGVPVEDLTPSLRLGPEEQQPLAVGKPMRATDHAVLDREFARRSAHAEMSMMRSFGGPMYEICAPSGENAGPRPSAILSASPPKVETT